MQAVKKIMPPSSFLRVEELTQFLVSVENEYEDQPTSLILDFSNVSGWDISAVLWLVNALSHMRNRWTHNDGNEIRICLPHQLPTTEGSSKSQMSADYLKRWGLKTALEELDRDVYSLLVKEQHGYFEVEQKYYKAREEPTLSSEILSTQLAHIRKVSADGKISDQMVDDLKSEFVVATFGKILALRCGISPERASKFSTEIVQEALENIREHPLASFGFISISPRGKSKELVLALIDDGEPISKTLYMQYYKWQENSDPEFASHLPDKTPENILDLDPIIRQEIVKLATEPGISSKEKSDGRKVGMGLHYIRNDTVDPIQGFGGHLTIFGAGVGVGFSAYKLADGGVSHRSFETNLGFSWPGNLIRVAIPITVDE